MRFWQCFVLFVAGLAWASAARAQTIDHAWRTIATVDVNAAYQLLLHNHPAASREANEPEFRRTLESAHALALQRGARVTGMDGYAAVLRGFANAMDDGHIRSRLRYRSDNVQWAGLVIVAQRDQFVVVEQAVDNGPSLTGASLASCDGVDAERFAREKLGGFYAIWSIEAQRSRAAPNLLVDDGNPFVLKPRACTFAQNGALTQVELHWRAISRSELQRHQAQASVTGAAGYGLRDFAGGSWIALQGLQEDAAPVIAAVRAQAEHLRSAPIVVLDLRGNGGGSTDYGRAVARILFGQARMDAILGSEHDAAACDTVWRASPGNIILLRSYLTRFGGDPEVSEVLRRTLEKTERAHAGGRDFGAPLQCATHVPPISPPPPAARGRIYVLTDNGCFSSCLLVVDDFRRLGAVQVGQPTDADTHYGEVRDEPLPSGLSTFSTLASIIPDRPAAVGPFQPVTVYPGRMADTAALEAWVARLPAP